MKHALNYWHLFGPFFHSFAALAIGALAVGVRKWWQRVRENRAAMWPSADGEVQAATVKQQHGSWVVVRYCYYALQEYRYGQYRRHFARKAAAKEFAAAIQGRHLQVRYREDDPNVSVIVESDLRMTGALSVR
jgi:hypothetical protein